MERFEDEIRRIYSSIRSEIRDRLDQFKKIRKTGSEEKFFVELAFCLLTPQSKAETCWAEVAKLVERGLLFNGTASQIAKVLNVRFKNNKAGYIASARSGLTVDGRLYIKGRLESFTSASAARMWFIENVKGMGYKEGSHFLRNVGFGDDFAILDRHVLKNLKSLGVIAEIPTSLTNKRYIQIEGRMKKFSEKIDIAMGHLDLVLWYRETGKIFK